MTVPLEERLRRALAASAELEPSAALNRAVRRLLVEPAGELRPFGRPAMAAGLAVAALLALLAGLSTVFADTVAADRGPSVALALIAVYLVISSAAALPLLFIGPWRRAVARGG